MQDEIPNTVETEIVDVVCYEILPHAHEDIVEGLLRIEPESTLRIANQ